MNPFDLRGPQFLLFYVAAVALVSAALLLARIVFEGGPVPRLPSVDPYLVAQLRGGAREAVRVAILSLVDRGVLSTTGGVLSAKPGAQASVRRPLEREVIATLSRPRLAHELPEDPRVLEATAALQKDLMAQGLAPSAVDQGRRMVEGGAALLGLWALSWTKLAIAIGRGRSNFGFLVVFTVAATFVVIALVQRARTARGDRLLADLRVLFEGLKARGASLRAGGQSAELALLVAVYGFGALEGKALFEARALFPNVSRSDGGRSSCGSGSSYSGSSCSSGSSCGSSCGGGGGGGCGGCGS